MEKANKVKSMNFDGNSLKDSTLIELINEWVKLTGSTITPTALIRDLLTRTLKSEIQALLNLNDDETIRPAIAG
ncbi:MAG: hypothetical protein FVQ82_12935 [Planctomycetes bacterium]|nr:hypothetical protein [Planctomycetota bacterium]